MKTKPIPPSVDMKTEIPRLGGNGASNGSRSTEVQSLYQRLMEWDTTVMKRYMVEKEVYTAEEVDQVEVEYKRFLALTLGYPGVPVPISMKVDHFWHTHILFTEDYSMMGKVIVGRYIHHRPWILDEIDELKAKFKAETLHLYREHFGDPDPKYWTMACCKACTCHCNSKE